jgi:hypothetical protein
VQLWDFAAILAARRKVAKKEKIDGYSYNGGLVPCNRQ